MECIFGLVGDGFTLLVADASARRSVFLYKQDEDKIFPIDEHKAMAVTGEPGDTTLFAELIQKNLALCTLRVGVPRSPHATAHFTRAIMAENLRRSPYFVNLLLAGHDKDEGPSLYYLDYLASLQKLNFAAHGYGAFFILSLFDRYYRPGMSLPEAIKLANLCIAQLRLRFVISTPAFTAKVVDTDGVRMVDLKNEEEMVVVEE